MPEVTLSLKIMSRELYGYSLETPIRLNFPHGFLYALRASGTSYFLERKLSLNGDISGQRERLQTSTHPTSFILSKVDERKSTFTENFDDIDYPRGVISDPERCTTIRSHRRQRDHCILTGSTVDFNLGRLLAETRRKCPYCVFRLVFQSIESASKVRQSHILGRNIWTTWCLALSAELPVISNVSGITLNGWNRWLLQG